MWAFVGVFAKTGVQTWCFRVVNVVTFVVKVWREMTPKSAMENRTGFGSLFSAGLVCV
jgi:hypothetical protein